MIRAIGYSYIAYLLLCIVGGAGIIDAIRKNKKNKGNWFALVVAIGFFIYNAIGLGYSFHPIVADTYGKFDSSLMGVSNIRFAAEDCFETEAGDCVDFDCSPFVHRKYLNEGEYEKNMVYHITYDKRSNCIISLEEMPNGYPDS